MARVEVDEEQLRADSALRDAIGRIRKNPQALLKLQEAHKLADPENALTPQLDQQNAIATAVAPIASKLDEFIKGEKERRDAEERERKLSQLRADQDAGIARLRSSGKWTDKGIEAVQKLMEEKGILDVDIAAAHVEKQMPPTAPVTPKGMGSWNFMDMPDDTSDDLKRLIATRGESDAVIDRMAAKALAEVRQR